MRRAITGFELDAESHWVAQLSCGHRQHTRHDPPLAERPWVLTAKGRAARMGSPLDCAACDRSQIPEGFEAYRRTNVFSEATLPDGLRRNHTTRRGVWGLIRVLEGTLEYHVGSPYDRRELLSARAPGIVLPEVEHRISTESPVRFYVEFWQAARANGQEE